MYLYIEKHIYSILAKDFQRKKRKTHHKEIHKNTEKLHYTKGKAGPWVPSLENWGSKVTESFMGPTLLQYFAPPSVLGVSSVALVLWLPFIIIV